MNRVWLVGAVVLAAASISPATVQVVLEADADSYVRCLYNCEDGYEFWWDRDTNYGGQSRLLVVKTQGRYSLTEIAYMHFDFSGLGGYDGADLVRAQLILLAEQAAQGEQRAYVVREPWDEMTITYNNRPPRGAQVASFYLYKGYTYVDLDIGPIAPWVDSPETAHGVELEDAELVTDWDDEGMIYSRETGTPPNLRLTFTGEAVEGASWGEIKASFE